MSLSVLHFPHGQTIAYGTMHYTTNKNLALLTELTLNTCQQSCQNKEACTRQA